MDIYDSATVVETLERENSIRAQLERSKTPIPVCENCDEELVHVTATGTRFRYCRGCTFELTGRIYDN